MSLKVSTNSKEKREYEGPFYLNELLKIVFN